MKIKTYEPRTVEQVNADINAIFKKHKISQPRGTEDFWNKVDDIGKKSKSDMRKLENLYEEWDEVTAN